MIAPVHMLVALKSATFVLSVVWMYVAVVLPLIRDLRAN